MNLQCDDCKNTDKEVLYCWDCNQLNAEHTTCTKCTVKPIVKEHMCEKCYTEHCEWLRDQPKGIRIGDYLAKNHKFSKEDLEKAIDDDQWYTLYESGDNSGRISN